MDAFDRARIVGAALLALPASGCLLTIDDENLFEPDAAAGPSKYRAAVLADAPLAYWRLGDESLPDAKDEKGAFPGIYKGGAKLGAAGAIHGDPDTAVAFAAPAESWVDVPGDALHFTGSVSFTLEAWIAPSGFDGDYRGIMAFDGESAAGVQGYLLWVQDAQGLGFERFSDGTDLCLSTNAVPPTGTFSHVVATFEAGVMTLYQNAEEVASKTLPGSLGDFDGRFVIGAHTGGAHSIFNGVIDEVAVYGHALTSDQVRAHYDAGKP